MFTQGAPGAVRVLASRLPRFATGSDRLDLCDRHLRMAEVPEGAHFVPSA